MNSKMKSYVQNENHLSDDFDCNIGTRQGCQLNPLVFLKYVNELMHLVEENNCQGIYEDEHNQLGECGRDRTYVTYYVKCIKF